MGLTPKISIIIPTYNRGWTVKEAIESVLNQTFRDFELIVVDDGSTDDTPRILDTFNMYGEKVVVVRQENRGVSAARNRGIRHAGGDLVAFLDSDDLWLPEKLAAQAAFFDQHPDAMICQTEEIWIRNGRRVNPKNRHKKPSGMIFEPSLPLCLVSPSAVMMRRSIFQDIGYFDEALPACEDYDLWLRIALKYPVHLIPTPLIVKRGGHEDQLSRMPMLDKYRIAALDKLLRKAELTPAQRKAAAGMLREKCRIYAAGCKKRGRLDEARHYENLSDLHALYEGMPDEESKAE